MTKSIIRIVTIICLCLCMFACSSNKKRVKAQPKTAADVTQTTQAAVSSNSGPYASSLDLFYASKYSQCVDDVTAIMKKSGETAEGLTIRGIALTKLGQTYSAYRDLNAVVAMNRTATSLYNLGNALRMAGYCARAADAYEQALALSPGDIKILVNLTSSYLCYGNIDAADGTFAQLVGKLPADRVALTVAGTVSAMAEDFTQSKAAAKKALEYDAYYRPAYKLLMQSCNHLKELDCAKEAEKQYNFLSNRYNRPKHDFNNQL